MMLHSRKRRFSQKRRSRLESLEERRVLDSTVVFNELLYHPAVETTETEWVELHNQMAVNMDVSGWMIDGIGYQFPERTTIPRGGYVVIAKDPERLIAQTGLTDVFGPFDGRLSNSGEQLSLRNISNREMDVIEFSDRAPWPAAADGSGVSIAKRHPQTGSAQASNWTSSVLVGGTPGRENFPTFDPAPTTNTVIARDAVWQFDDSGQNLGTGWREPEFQDATWSSGEAPLYSGSFPTIQLPGGGLGEVTAQSIVIQNPSFEANSHDDVGYGDIDGWAVRGSTGINPTTSGNAPFADNGFVPDQRHVGFIQGRGSVSQLVSGFELDQEYWLELHYNARACCGANPSITVSYAGTVLLAPTPVEPVGGTNDYYVSLVPFTPATESGQLLIRNVGATGDHTLLLDAVAIIPRDDQQVAVTNASFEASGIVDQPVTFGNLVGWNHTGGGEHGVSTQLSAVHDNGQVPDGQSVAFLSGTGTLQQTISGLVPGERYELRYQYNARSGTPAPTIKVSVDDRVMQDATVVTPVGQAMPYHQFSRQFTATAESIVVTIEQTGADATATLFLDNLMLRRELSPLVTETASGPNTHYFRHEFEFTGDPLRTELSIRQFVDDGAVVYLNGAEIRRANMAMGAVNASTRAVQAIGDPLWTDLLPVSEAPLVSGRNLLAVEVHQVLADDPDMAFGLELVANEFPLDPTLDPVTIGINELSGGGAESLSVELFNYGDTAVQLDEQQIIVGGRIAPLPDQPLLPQALFVASIAAPFEQGDLVSLFNPRLDIVVDSLHVSNGPVARMPNGNGPILNESSTTFGELNQVDLTSSIVINEVMYHQLPTLATPGTPASFELATLIPLDGTWHYNEAGGGLPASWHQSAHPVGGDWKQGQGLLGFETGRVIDPGLGTTLSDDGVLTFYFEKEFDVSADLLAGADSFQIRHAIDDGAVFYLNGVEFLRFNLPDGPIDAETLALLSVNNAELSSAIDIPKELISLGANRLSVELHQRSQTSSDVVFGVELAAATIVDPGVASTPFVEDPEEWIELFNRSARPVDLTGWSFDEALEYAFPAVTVLQPGGYLVIAKDPVLMQLKYPAMEILGPYDGRLNNNDDRIVLRDSLLNPADEVHYYDSGRWADAADGGGASLELSNPFADNSVAESWSASLPNSDSEWGSYTLRVSGAQPDGLNAPTGFHELVLGLLDTGEMLLDDLQLIADPDGAAVQLMQNGQFESDVIGDPPAHWRWVGNHGSTEVIADPRDPSNQVLRLVANGPTEHMSNHGESTFADGVRISPAETYELSFKALWINGSPQLNSRLYFARGGMTTVIETNNRQGTPGEQNSTWQANLGPVYADLAHSPIVPQADEPVEVSISADDPDGVSEMTLRYAVGSDDFVSVPMTLTADGRFRGSIPGQADNATVQFYVIGRDQQGAESQFPTGGADSRALYTVAKPLENETGHGLRVIMTRPDISTLHRSENVMSNGRLGATVIYNDTEVFYDVGVRLRASGFGRRGQLAGFNIQFDPQQLFRGVHKTIAIDRGAVFSNGNGGGVRGVPGASAHELLIYQVANHAGGIAGMYDDVVYVDAPRGANTGMALLKMARYSDVFLDTFFEDGDDGSLFKYELIYHSNRTRDGDPESLKQPPDSVVGTDISDLGDGKEPYRYNFILKNNRAADDYQGIISLGQAFSQSGQALDTASQEIMDLDAWMRMFALQSLVGTADTYNMGLAHNLELFVRPDGKVVPLPWDVDHGFFYPTNSNILGRGGSNLQKVINLPHNKRLFHKHLLDLVQTTYNTEYLSEWAEHYEQVTQHEDLAAFFVRYVNDRSEFVLSRLERDAPVVSFEITSNAGQALVTDDLSISLEGTGWIDVHSIHLQQSQETLAVEWLDQERWRVDLPLIPGENQIELEAFNYRGAKVGVDQISIVSTAEQLPLRDHLRIVELMYHPASPSEEELAVNPSWQQDDFEFVELMNTSATISLDLAGVRFVDGPAEPFEFGPDNRSLLPGERIVIVSNLPAFSARYAGVSVAGEYAGNLRNGGEYLRMVDSQDGVILEFKYSDSAPWPAAADGGGASLELVNPHLVAANELQDPQRWMASVVLGGSPGYQADLAGDVTKDGRVDVADIDHLCKAPKNDLSNDLNQDGIFDSGDLTYLIQEILNTSFGDANLDGLFDSSDLVGVFRAGQYEDNVPGNSTWSTGDWNCDSEFTTSDLVVAMQGGGFIPAARMASIVVRPRHASAPFLESTGDPEATARIPEYPRSDRPVDLIFTARDLVFKEWIHELEGLSAERTRGRLSSDEFENIGMNLARRTV